MIMTKVKIATAVLLISSAGLGATGTIYYVRARDRTEQSVLPASVKNPELTRVATRQVKPEKFTLGKETTYVTGPLDHDGYVDYETALNERLGKGVTAENNANVLLWQALNPAPKRTPMPEEFFQRLKISEPPPWGDYFIDMARYANIHLKLNPGEQTEQLFNQRRWAAQRPWVAQNYPLIVDWLKANEKPLAVIVEATKRPDYHNPLVSRKSGEEGWYGLIGALLPGAVKCYREVAPALAARAMLHTGEGRFDEAWQDLLACHRLGRLLVRGAEHNEFVLGLAVDEAAGDAVLALLDRAQPTLQQARAWQRDLERLPPNPAVADKVDLGLRFKFLNTVMLARHSPVKTLRLIEVLEGRSKPQPGVTDPEPPEAFVSSLDWNGVLRTGNVWHDRVVAAQRGKDRSGRDLELKRMEEELKAHAKGAESPADVIKALGQRQIPGLSDQLAWVLIDFLQPTVRQMQRSADLTEQTHRNLQLAFALAVYRGEHGSYPDKLAALAPIYLPEVPNDLFSGKELIYRASENGYLFYSIGVNGRDEQGRGSADVPAGDDLQVRMPQPELKRK
jgi:hypothetical protein